MKLYNSLTRKKEDFKPINENSVGVYTCGPTVYYYPQIGNWRTFALGDFMVRSLKYLGYSVHYVMNITDVGHLTGDNLGDADIGEDRLEKTARKENKTAWDVAKFYTNDFLSGYRKMNMTMPTLDNNREGFGVATDYINEQIEMIKKIEAKGFAYKTSDGVYFDIQAYEKAGNKYGRMSNIHKDNALARVEPNPEKRDNRDFALWKFSYTGGRDFDPARDDKFQKRSMEWESPWGLGYPGWHIECSAISSKYLGQQFDIHIGGEDHKSTHHPGEIAQSEAVSGKKPFVKYWIHGAFLQVEGKRMGKSLGNAYTLQDVEAKGFDPMDLRYFYLTGHYRKKLNFTWEALSASKNGLDRLRDQVAAARMQKSRTMLSDEKQRKVENFQAKFRTAISDDLNMPQALAVLWEVVKSNVPSEDKYDLAVSFDEVLGLRLKDAVEEKGEKDLDPEINKLIEQRDRLRKEKKFKEADEIRERLEEKGVKLIDTKGSTQVD